MADAIDLTVVATAAGALGISAADASLPRLITAASQAIADWLGYPVHSREDVAETLVGDGGPYVWTQAGCVRSAVVAVGGVELEASQVRIDNAIRGRLVVDSFPFTGAGSAGISSAPVLSYRTGELTAVLSCGWVTPGQNALDAETYPAVDLPASIEQAAIEVVTAWYARKGRDQDIASLSVGSGSVSYADKQAIPATARLLLSSYRKRVG